MRIQAASLTQIARARNGRMVVIDDDAGAVAAQLREIDPALRLSVSDVTGHYVVSQMLDDGTEHLVLTALELDGRIVRRVREIAHPSYDYAADLEAVEAEAEREQDHKRRERVGEIGERLAHAIRKDTGERRTF